jgi:hypothetical protein
MFQKELIIGCLISYVALDIMLGIMVHKNNPEIISELKDAFVGKEVHLVIIVAMSLVIGCLFSNCFGCKKLF